MTISDENVLVYFNPNSSYLETTYLVIRNILEGWSIESNFCLPGNYSTWYLQQGGAHIELWAEQDTFLFVLLLWCTLLIKSTSLQLSFCSLKQGRGFALWFHLGWNYYELVFSSWCLMYVRLSGSLINWLWGLLWHFLSASYKMIEL